MRDLKDYLVTIKGSVPVNPGSPFNIKTDSIMVSNFSQNDISRLFAQRTEEIGQQITPEAIDYIWEQSGGQPWIVNSLLERVTMRILDRNNTETVTLEHILTARQQMLLARETHLDALAYRLQEPGVRAIMETLILGDIDFNLETKESFRLCLDLGLITYENQTMQIANPIYREILARHLTYGIQMMLPQPKWKWQKDDGSLDMDALLKEFQKFWRLNSEEWEEKSDYTEIFPHLLLQAFLQRVINGGGEIEREYAAGRGRMDLAVKYNGKVYIIEIKLLRKYKTPRQVLEGGLEQIAEYRARFSKDTPAYLLIFDRRPDKPAWEERIYWKEEAGIVVLGC
jgi:hypothetical protein